MDLFDIEQLAKKHMSIWLDDSWSFAWNNRKRGFGLCVYSKNEIQLSQYLIPHESDEEILDTILHEIAHALTPGAGHNARWKMMAMRVGAKPQTRGGKPKANIPPKWIMINKANGEIINKYYRKPSERRMRTIADSWLPGKKEETRGNLMYMKYDQYLKVIDAAAKKVRKSA